ncbi:Hypothetical_protein [Hexamita inflata]|uniref:Hypothetical_protein n=1 Tax=Hexamita inflata TaxID=28002 RepID=A0AA86VA32_9EUKA|nr:Hypothetical protein HINF_LOCUS48348 [Hexamita inflata]
MNKKKRQQLYAHTERIPFEINQFSSQQLFNIETQWKTIEDKYLVNHHLQSQIIPPTLKPAKKIIKQQDVSQCCRDNKYLKTSRIRMAKGHNYKISVAYLLIIILIIIFINKIRYCVSPSIFKETLLDGAKLQL